MQNLVDCAHSGGWASVLTNKNVGEWLALAAEPSGFWSDGFFWVSISRREGARFTRITRKGHQSKRATASLLIKTAVYAEKLKFVVVLEEKELEGAIWPPGWLFACTTSKPFSLFSSDFFAVF